MHESSDAYLYPGSDVLRNFADIRDLASLADFETDAAAARIAQLDDASVKGAFDAAQLRAIHQHIFQDVYAWAGPFRAVNISMGGRMFGAGGFIEQALFTVLRKLPGEDCLRGLDRENSAPRAGFYPAEINAIHPFREGNGRAQRELIRELGVEAGYQIKWYLITAGETVAASAESFQTADSSGLEALILRFYARWPMTASVNSLVWAAPPTSRVRYLPSR
jgi:cell filamentation protein